jgi:predicted heme/steroid binding protein
LLALKGIIYDVSSSDFYSKGGAYSVFSGHDASVNLAKMSHDAQYLDKYETYKLDSD